MREYNSSIHNLEKSLIIDPVNVHSASHLLAAFPYEEKAIRFTDIVF